MIQSRGEPAPCHVPEPDASPRTSERSPGTRPIQGPAWQVPASGASPGKSRPRTCRPARQLHSAPVQFQDVLPCHACHQQNTDKSRNDGWHRREKVCQEPQASKWPARRAGGRPAPRCLPALGHTCFSREEDGAHGPKPRFSVSHPPRHTRLTPPTAGHTP